MLIMILMMLSWFRVMVRLMVLRLIRLLCIILWWLRLLRVVLLGSLWLLRAVRSLVRRLRRITCRLFVLTRRRWIRSFLANRR